MASAREIQTPETGSEELGNVVVDEAASLGVKRFFTIPGRDPFEEIEWETRDAYIPGKDKPVFEQKGVEFPKFWSQTAAKMVVLDVDHPDVEEFIWCKAREEEKARVLEQAGYDMSLDSGDWASIQYQNANNSVRVTDGFMEAADADADWNLTARTDGSVVETTKAKELLRQIADAAWRSADPGVQYDTTINKWHTLPNTSRINASNPCSEYMSIDDSACNLASLNLMKFRREDGELDVEALEHAIDTVFLAQEILVGYSSYPTLQIEHNAKSFRQLGLGYANLGALLMARGLPYDSDEGRAYAAAITALMTGRAYRKSAEIAARMGPFAGHAANKAPMLGVMSMHR